MKEYPHTIEVAISTSMLGHKRQCHIGRGISSFTPGLVHVFPGVIDHLATSSWPDLTRTKLPLSYPFDNSQSFVPILIHILKMTKGGECCYVIPQHEWLASTGGHIIIWSRPYIPIVMCSRITVYSLTVKTRNWYRSKFYFWKQQ